MIGVHPGQMVESPGARGAGSSDAEARQIGEVTDRIARRYAHRAGVHRDVIEAAVRSGWAKYDTAKVTTYRAILAERAALDALQAWFGDPARLGVEAETGDDSLAAGQPDSEPARQP